jgi:hypothetical protein
MSHPTPHGEPDLTPIAVGKAFENPVTRERSAIVERPWDNPEGHLTSEMTAFVGSRVAGTLLHSQAEPLCSFGVPNFLMTQMNLPDVHGGRSSLTDVLRKKADTVYLTAFRRRF